MPKLDKVEENLSEKELFLKWLLDERINFIELTQQYTQYLETENNKKTTKVNRYSTLLAQFLQYANLTTKTEWVKDKTIGMLYAYKDFETAPIHDTWKEIIQNNKINTDLNTLDYEVYKS